MSLGGDYRRGGGEKEERNPLAAPAHPWQGPLTREELKRGPAPPCNGTTGALECGGTVKPCQRSGCAWLGRGGRRRRGDPTLHQTLEPFAARLGPHSACQVSDLAAADGREERRIGCRCTRRTPRRSADLQRGKPAGDADHFWYGRRRDRRRSPCDEAGGPLARALVVVRKNKAAASTTVPQEAPSHFFRYGRMRGGWRQAWDLWSLWNPCNLWNPNQGRTFLEFLYFRAGRLRKTSSRAGSEPSGRTVPIRLATMMSGRPSPS